MDCPACKQPLIVVEREGIEVDWCPACKGIWFDAGELELLAESARREFVMPAPDPTGAQRAAGGRPRTCPRCPAKLWLRTVPCDPPVQIDLCPRGHGIWLDQGELGALLSAMPEANRGVTTQSESSRAAMAQTTFSFLGEVFQASLARAPSSGGGSADPQRATPPTGSA